ncbi:MAG: nitrite reductase [Symbiobacteriaceae bacterium]|nr:nitrite reductase [Symbiobacteriaceae bacterium]
MELKAFAVTPGLKHKFTGRQLAALGAAVGDDASVELTTVQQLLVRMDASRWESARAVIAEQGMKIYPVGEVVKNVRACGFCQGDDVEGYPAAVALDEAVAGLPTAFPLRIAYSGCPNGCAEPLVQDIGVVKVGDGFNLYVGGKASGLLPRPGLLLAEAIPEESLPDTILRVIRFYQEQGKKRERFWKFVDRVGMETLAQVLAQPAQVE